MTPIYTNVSKIEFSPYEDDFYVKSVTSDGVEDIIQDIYSYQDLVCSFGRKIANQLVNPKHYVVTEDGNKEIHFDIDECDGCCAPVIDAAPAYDFNAAFGTIGNPNPIGGPDRWDRVIGTITSPRKKSVKKHGRIIRKK